MLKGLSVGLSICQFICRSIYLSVHLSVPSFICQSVHSSVLLLVHLFVGSSVSPSFISSSVGPFIRCFICRSVSRFICPIYPSICLCLSVCTTSLYICLHLHPPNLPHTWSSIHLSVSILIILLSAVLLTHLVTCTDDTYAFHLTTR